MTDAIDPVVAYARRAFGSHQQALAFYLREVTAPGEFDRIAATLFRRYRSDKPDGELPDGKGNA